MSKPAKPAILVIDDELDVVRLLKVVLEMGGMTVHTALGGQEAVGVSRQHPEIDLAIIDVLMPNWDGPAVLKALRHINPRIRCCFATGMIDGRARQWADMGVVRVFQKPFHLASLAELVFELAVTRPEPSRIGQSMPAERRRMRFPRQQILASKPS
jgi:two-component system, cell cycle sensor histidine kinase and response regulator CckA